ncbi:silencing information regulator [Arthroderma uncinatum]|uniref:silencing information regulator n=1 Tax=Arthroderma uncinatum TaxID=74035 RepID=UPI00144ACD9F|nr:silencing information regulator [Arthroderma uncinatum]KAF3484006.1 silencing information regulator [Arthroderma uncinatum]
MASDSSDSSESLSKLERLRTVDQDDIGRLERYSTARNSLKFYTNVAVTVTYVLPSTCSLPLKDCIYKALETLIGQHPVLSAIPLEEDSKDPYFARLPEVNLDRCVTFQERKSSFPAAESEGESEVEPERDAELDELLNVQHNASFAAPLPYWRLCVLTDPRDSRQFTAAYVWHHAIGDGSSGKAFHKTFLQALHNACSAASADVKSVIPSPKTPLLPNLEKVYPMPLSFFFILSILFWTKIWKAARDPGLWTGSKITTPLENQVRHLVISKRDTAALRDLCRENKTTVTAALQTLLANALFTNLPGKFTSLRCEGAISNRRWLTDDNITDDSIGVWVQDFQEMYSRDKLSKNGERLEFSWDEARRSKQNLDRILSLRGKNSMVAMLKFVDDYQNELFLPKVGKEREKSFEISNVGVFKSSQEELEAGEKGPRYGRMVFTQTKYLFRTAGRIAKHALPMSQRMRIPFTAPFSPPIILPSSANTLSGAIDAIASFLSAAPPALLRGVNLGRNEQTVLLTGAGISVASGLADYRGENGTYRRNVAYRPIYFHEYVNQHEARKRYWARSFIGWPTMGQSKPNITHESIRELGKKGYISSVITQNVDSLHGKAHPHIPVVELHGYLRSVICVSCRHKIPRPEFQESLFALNPPWAEFLNRITESGALDTDSIEQQRQRGLKLNPDGDVDLTNAHYSDFRYPACPRCLENPPLRPDGSRGIVEADQDGALASPSNAGILKPAVVMFGESVNEGVKVAAEEAIDEAGKLLVLGTSLATFSAWRLVERAIARGMSIGVLNVGGFRNEAALFGDLAVRSGEMTRVRCSQPAEAVIPEVVARLQALA